MFIKLLFQNDILYYFMYLKVFCVMKMNEIDVEIHLKLNSIYTMQMCESV